MGPHVSALYGEPRDEGLAGIEPGQAGHVEDVGLAPEVEAVNGEPRVAPLVD